MNKFNIQYMDSTKNEEIQDRHRAASAQGYDAMSQRMVQLAEQQPGCLGVESARETLGIPAARWRKPDNTSIARFAS
jgi:hypothetical protein